MVKRELLTDEDIEKGRQAIQAYDNDKYYSRTFPIVNNDGSISHILVKQAKKYIDIDH